jgi:hypothetical protein
MRKFLIVFAMIAGAAFAEAPEGIRVAKLRRGPQGGADASCRVSFSACLAQCTRDDVRGCVMECETDCSVCVLEESGQLNSPICEPK